MAWLYRGGTTLCHGRAMFPGFTIERMRTSGAEIHLRRGGAGPPVLLLHGYPQTHVAWHAVAPRLAERFTVVCPDLRGYGDSSRPPSTPDHAPYAKRAMAQDLIEMMAQLGFERFAVAGHDRGGRVAYRMALDHPDRVARLADLGVRAIVCPVLVLWGAAGLDAEVESPLEVWRRWATDVRGRGLPCGHFLPEEAPDDTAAELLRFL